MLEESDLQAGPLTTQWPDRRSRWKDLHLTPEPVEQFDGLASEFREDFDGNAAMINLVGIEFQHFPGLGVRAGLASTRRMTTGEGWCPHVVNRGGRSFTVRNTGAYSRFASNPALDEYGVMAYLGTGLIDTRHSGLVLGTICVVDGTARPEWDDSDVRRLKQWSTTVMDVIYDRADRQGKRTYL